MFEEEEVRTFDSIGELDEYIGEVERSEPVDKRTKEWKTWRSTINNLYSLYNQKIGFKAYKVEKL